MVFDVTATKLKVEEKEVNLNWVEKIVEDFRKKDSLGVCARFNPLAKVKFPGYNKTFEYSS
ncbi:MAG: hypothetical protein ACTMUB_07120 [cyanobacterium endosymbiont of Rhopalodia musculus]|uniref:hypothetical protein n=1 Tax=cyanobacterium endosymbiont of Epithemia clementina EcSB TaxID=3034674 RepID=UPI0024811E92|nr:hypothetical protein [cyanobacterium endosymbiont of Epithemia clementina EcSB]WGT67870.1 hypothetical protein P3F56_01935 [cyanobacterium endosymbiont of Epithemia clementina EcSB]